MSDEQVSIGFGLLLNVDRLPDRETGVVYDYYTTQHGIPRPFLRDEGWFAPVEWIDDDEALRLIAVLGPDELAPRQRQAYEQLCERVDRT